MYGQFGRVRFALPGAVARPIGWVAAFLGGSVLGLTLRLICFLTGALGLKALSAVFERLSLVLPVLDPVYTRAAERTLGYVQIRGVAFLGPLGDRLHTWLPDAFVPASQAHWAFVRLVVEPGSPVLGRLLASGFAHAACLPRG